MMNFIIFVFIIWVIIAVSTREFDFEHIFLAVVIALLLSGVLNSPRVS